MVFFTLRAADSSVVKHLITNLKTVNEEMRNDDNKIIREGHLDEHSTVT